MQQLIRAAKFNEAIEQSKQLLKQTSDTQHCSELWYLIAVAQRYIKEYSQALSSIKHLLSYDKNHSRAYQEQGYINLLLNQPLQAKSRANLSAFSTKQ